MMHYFTQLVVIGAWPAVQGRCISYKWFEKYNQLFITYWEPIYSNILYLYLISYLLNESPLLSTALSKVLFKASRHTKPSSVFDTLFITQPARGAVWMYLFVAGDWTQQSPSLVLTAKLCLPALNKSQLIPDTTHTDNLECLYSPKSIALRSFWFYTYITDLKV